MSATTPPAVPTPAKRVKKRIVIPGAILTVLAAALLLAVVRANWADDTPRNPAAPAEGIVTQLYRTPEGHVQVRNAVILDTPPVEVWAVVTDYDHFTEIFPTITSAHGERQAGGTVRLRGTVSSPVGDWPIDVAIRHEETPAKWVASWDEAGKDVTVNRGSWTLTPAGNGQTLLVYALEVEVARYPTFLVRNVLLSRQRTVVAAVIDHLQRKQARP